MNAASVLSKPSVVLARPSKTGDAAFKFLTWLMAMMVFVLVFIVGWELFKGARPSLQKFGFGFLVHSDWDPVNNVFGALPFIFGTFVSSLVGLAIALPLSLATAVYLTELAPGWIRHGAISLIEMLAAIPSVILGLWGIFVMVPWLRDHPFPLLRSLFGFLPLFKGPIYGVSVLSAAIIIAIMIVPIITSISREVFRAVPDSQREAAFALGATRWEVTRLAVLKSSRRGIFGAAMLGLGRALGETMAVTMVIGNRPDISASLFAPGYTLASAIANEFAEATGAMHLSALFELGLVLLLVTLVTNIVARLLIGAMGEGKRA
ncbi:MAG TPA: phosphate ABC transporter permease subunit PstC [Verrucomicrobiae bacterium]|jgi:phosphate transport system permease protein|nr:phosphate ABC transporter permease subunit PstC [Verrucomicrobiae bacterium]